MYERLILCEYAVADLTTANANVFYELGVRHAVRPHSTVMIFAEGGRLPFDVAPLRALPYGLNSDGAPTDPDAARDAIAQRLSETKKAVAEGGGNDSPIYQLVENFPDIDHTKTDVFRERVSYSLGLKNRIADAREQGVEALRAVEDDLGPLSDVESGVVIDLLLSYRAVRAWQQMIDLVARMPRPLAETVMVQEQLGFALNRAGEGEKAEKVLVELIKRRGPSSETCGILGRVYKDRWEKAEEKGEKGDRSEKIKARALLKKAIETYLRGFESDWRDAYPGINAVTLMELQEPPDPRRLQITPVVTYAVERKIASAEPDYWDYATQIELAVLAKDEQKAFEALGNALINIREKWEPETTVNTLKKIRKARAARQESVEWADEIETELERRAK